MENLTRYNRHNFAIARACEVEGDSTYPLHMLHITETMTEATNGHYLMQVTTVADDKTEAKKPEPFSILIPGKQAVSIARRMIKRFWGDWISSKKKSRTTEQVRVSKSGVTVRIGNGDLLTSARIRPIETKKPYPITEAVIKDANAATVGLVGLNIDYLIEVLELMRDFADNGSNYKRGQQVSLFFYDQNTVFRMEAENKATGQKMIAHVMPLRL